MKKLIELLAKAGSKLGAGARVAVTWSGKTISSAAGTSIGRSVIAAAERLAKNKLARWTVRTSSDALVFFGVVQAVDFLTAGGDGATAVTSKLVAELTAAAPTISWPSEPAALAAKMEEFAAISRANANLVYECLQASGFDLGLANDILEHVRSESGEEFSSAYFSPMVESRTGDMDPSTPTSATDLEEVMARCALIKKGVRILGSVEAIRTMRALCVVIEEGDFDNYEKMQRLCRS